MSLARTDYPNIDERLYSTVLENGLRVLVVPRPGFLKKYAFFAANYGGISWSTSSSTCPGAAR